MPLPPGPHAPPVFNLGRFIVDPLGTLRTWYSRYGKIFAVRFPLFGTGIYVAEPSAIRELFTGDQSDLLAGEANSFMAPVLGSRSVLVLDGAEHMRQRKLLLTPFQGSRIAGFRSIIREIAEREIGSWRAGEEIVLRDRMRALAFDVICQAVFGVSEPERMNRLRLALVALIDASPVFMFVPPLQTDRGRFSPGRYFHGKLAAADALLLEEIARRRCEPDLDERTDVLSLLLCAADDDGEPMSDIELRDELITMLAAGHETSANALAFAFDLLIHSPAKLDRLRDELRDDGDDAYLDAVVKETLRVRPIIDGAERTLTKPRTVLGWELPAGVKVYPGIALVHMREDLYPRALSFQPERFLDAEAESYTWLPFGGGIRRCLGAALAQAEIAEVLRVAVPAVDLKPLRREPDPVVMRGITLVPRRGVHVLVARKSAVRVHTVAAAT